MTRYEIIFEALQDKVDNGELTLEDANILNDLAYDKYVTEGFFKKKKKEKTKSDFKSSGFKYKDIDITISSLLDEDEEKETLDSLKTDIKVLNNKLEKELENSDMGDDYKIDDMSYEIGNKNLSRFTMSISSNNDNYFAQFELKAHKFFRFQ